MYPPGRLSISQHSEDKDRDVYVMWRCLGMDIDGGHIKSWEIKNVSKG
jgi:hypothetical protein